MNNSAGTFHLECAPARASDKVIGLKVGNAL